VRAVRARCPGRPLHRQSYSPQVFLELGVSETFVRRLIREETLPATQVIANTPWIIARNSLRLPAVEQAVEALKSDRRLRRRDPGQQEFPLF